MRFCVAVVQLYEILTKSAIITKVKKQQLLEQCIEVNMNKTVIQILQRSAKTQNTSILWKMAV